MSKVRTEPREDDLVRALRKLSRENQVEICWAVLGDLHLRQARRVLRCAFDLAGLAIDMSSIVDLAAEGAKRETLRGELKDLRKKLGL
jgi:hypothetical protein